MEPGHDAIASVNRLLRKHPGVSEHVGEFQLPADRFTIAEEAWRTDQLAALLHPSSLSMTSRLSPQGRLLLLDMARGTSLSMVAAESTIGHGLVIQVPIAFLFSPRHHDT
jgi:hypothetical protein